MMISSLKRRQIITLTFIVGAPINLTVIFSTFSASFLLGRQLPTKLSPCSVRTNLFEATSDSMVEDQSLESTKGDLEVSNLKLNLVELADRTNRGFAASAGDKKKANDIVQSLQALQTIPDPARAYYDPPATPVTSSVRSDNDDKRNSISGKWTLIYTDAPDIIGLDTSRNPFSTAKLGRIGQECSPPYIKNVIEWVRPNWAENLPFSGSDKSRILQKVVTSGLATPAKPTFVELKVAGLELESGNVKGTSGRNANDILEIMQNEGLPAGILSINPIDLKGPLNPPFGRFEILYLDQEFRAIRTSQNYLAVNRRIVSKEDEWF
mmetsp:Transcript_11089/g.26631  ORF Transcript_11089/g.26631 Transcript_11089/m.26631 type:complete len:323 (+) Transcript_11089:76-1044(+)